MGKIFGAVLAVCGIGFFYYLYKIDLEEERLSKQYLDSLVTREELVALCKERGVWIPAEGEIVKIRVDNSIGMVVFTALDLFESYDLLFANSENVDPNNCEVVGVDVRTGARGIVSADQHTETSATSQPYAVVRFMPFELARDD